MNEETVALSEEHEQAWRAYLRSHALLKRVLDAELRTEHQLSLLTYDALVQLSEAPQQSMYMRDLAAALLYSASGLTRIVDGLERAGYVARRVDPTNRRAILVTLTDEGIHALQQAWPTHVRGVQTYFARHIDPDQARRMHNALRAVAEELENLSA